MQWVFILSFGRNRLTQTRSPPFCCYVPGWTSPSTRPSIWSDRLADRRINPFASVRRVLIANGRGTDRGFKWTRKKRFSRFRVGRHRFYLAVNNRIGHALVYGCQDGFRVLFRPAFLERYRISDDHFVGFYRFVDAVGLEREKTHLVGVHDDRTDQRHSVVVGRRRSGRPVTHFQRFHATDDQRETLYLSMYSIWLCMCYCTCKRNSDGY